MNDSRLISIATRLAALSRELDEILRSAVASPPPVEAAVTVVPPPAVESRSLLVTQRQFADLLGVHVRTLQRMRSEGLIPQPVAIGERPRWRRGDVERWIAERSTR